MTLIHYVNDETFQQEVYQLTNCQKADSKAVLVYFWIHWHSNLESFAQDYQNRCKVVLIDLQSNPKLCEQFHLKDYPVAMLFKNNKVIATRYDVACSKLTLMAWVDNALTQHPY